MRFETVRSLLEGVSIWMTLPIGDSGVSLSSQLKEVAEREVVMEQARFSEVPSCTAAMLGVMAVIGCSGRGEGGGERGEGEEGKEAINSTDFPTHKELQLVIKECSI